MDQQVAAQSLALRLIGLQAPQVLCARFHLLLRHAVAHPACQGGRLVTRKIHPAAPPQQFHHGGQLGQRLPGHGVFIPLAGIDWIVGGGLHGGIIGAHPLRKGAPWLGFSSLKWPLHVPTPSKAPGCY